MFRAVAVDSYLCDSIVVMLYVEWRIRKPWSSFTTIYNNNIITHNHHTNNNPYIYLLYFNPKSNQLIQVPDLLAAVVTLKAALNEVHSTDAPDEKAHKARTLRLETMMDLRVLCDEAEAIVPAGKSKSNIKTYWFPNKGP